MEPVKREGKWSLHLPSWVRDVGMKVLPWAIMGIIGTSIGLYADNIGNKRDIANNTRRLDQADVRDDRIEARLDRIEANDARRQREDEEFRGEVLDRLRKLLSLRR